MGLRHRHFRKNRAGGIELCHPTRAIEVGSADFDALRAIRVIDNIKRLARSSMAPASAHGFAIVIGSGTAPRN
jgi:hypothetical protein